MEPVAAHLAGLLNQEVLLPDAVIGDGVRRLVNECRTGQLVVLENLRFEPGETSNDAKFASALADLADVYVNDAFRMTDRTYASVVGVPAVRIEHAVGPTIERESTHLSAITDRKLSRTVFAMGGSRSLDLKLEALATAVASMTSKDAIFLGGTLATMFLAATGAEVGTSPYPHRLSHACRSFIAKAHARKVRLFLPQDVYVASDSESTPSLTRVRPTGDLRSNERIVDVGPNTLSDLLERIATADLVWCDGSLAVEEPSESTRRVGHALDSAPGFTIASGRDLLKALHEHGLGHTIDHLSTGDRATLALVAGRPLPGLDALRRNGTP